MNGTPRLRSAYPATPRSTGGRSRTERPPDDASSKSSHEHVWTSPAVTDSDGPLIPLSVIDAPTQRLYVSAFYIALTAWRLFDFWSIGSGDTESFWFFMKWVVIDGICLFGMPGLRIPWLEWSPTTMTLLFLCHAVLDIWLAFDAPIPLDFISVWLVKNVWDRELAVSERRVKPASILQNSSLILGKRIIHVLPEGSAMLNPNDGSFCIGASTKMIDLPILMNQTVPIALELLRIDLETNTNETIAVSGKELKKLKTQGGKTSGKKDTSMRTLLYPIRQTGLYRLLRVVDESKLEVQRQSSDVLVVTCPSGHIKTVASDKCRGELSDFYLHIKATPPLKIKYSKRINQEDRSHVSLTVHPENLETPMAPESPSDALTRIGRDSGDYSWAQTRHVQVPVNETFGIKGSWLYAIDEIEDGVGNIIDYTREISRPHKSARDGSISQSFVVHERPRAILEGCSPQKPLKAAKGRSRNLPVRFNPTGQFTTEAKHHITYSFLPQRSDSSGVDDEQTTSLSATLSGSDPGPEISEPGLYSLTSVASDYCAGEILEPSSCLLSNPPEPELALTSESIPHQCAGNSIGLRVNLDFIGTPPFEFTYNVHHRGHGKTVAVEKVAEMRTQLEFRPRDAGQYTYEFLDIADSVYRIPRSLRHATLKLEQDVKPTAWATFAQRSPQQQACIQEPATFQVRLSGDSPWDLDYDLVHNGKRTKHKISGIEDSSYTLTTPNLNAGGQYSLSLTSITDISGCRVHLKEEAKIDVRMQRPTAAFGMLEGSRSASTLQGKPLSLPVRFSGEPPWIMSYSRTGDGDIIHKQRFQAANDILSVDIADTYNIVDVSDKFCPGSVETKARQFEVLWIPKPSVALSRIPALEKVGDTFHKKAVCEGDHDSVELSFTGNSPYYVKYDVHMKPERGSAAVSTKQDKFGLHTASLRMDTAKSGVYQYAITELGDRLYNHDRKSAPLLQIQQQVHGRPSASFLNAGRTYNYCKEDAVGDEVIPIILTGAPPFTLEIGIKHLTAASPEINTEHVKSNRYDLRIPHTALSLGLHIISIRKVTDANGCQKIMGTDAPTTRVTVVDVPSISPLETATDFCVGDRISYTLVGTPPFRVHYSFEGVQQKASVSTNSFRRIAERPGNFTITAVSDKASTESCRARTKFTKVIHALPSVRISKGQTDELDIHEGGEADLLFEFEGTPPFYFTWTRSTNAGKGKKSQILETKDGSSHNYSAIVSVSQEGTYEVVSIRDRYCGFSTQKKKSKSDQQLLTF